MLKVAIAIDEWKLPIFERRLSQAGYAYEKGVGLTADTLLLTVQAENIEALGVVVKAANTEAARNGSTTMSETTLTDGSPVTPDHLEIDLTTGMQKGYVVLSAEERGKGFVRPVRRSYVHEKCGVVTTMGLALAETYARDPSFYGGTFCAGCRSHFPVGADGEFVWDGTTEKVGT